MVFVIYFYFLFVLVDFSGGHSGRPLIDYTARGQTPQLAAKNFCGIPGGPG
jgi:hypothetical protein